MYYQGRCLRFSCNDRTAKVNKLFIIWPFHYGPEFVKLLVNLIGPVSFLTQVYGKEQSWL